MLSLEVYPYFTFQRLLNARYVRVTPLSASSDGADDVCLHLVFHACQSDGKQPHCHVHSVFASCSGSLCSFLLLLILRQGVVSFQPSHLSVCLSVTIYVTHFVDSTSTFLACLIETGLDSYISQDIQPRPRQCHVSIRQHCAFRGAEVDEKRQNVDVLCFSLP